MMVHQGSSKNNASSMRKFAEKWREKVCEILVIGSRSGANDVLIVFSVMISNIYGLLMRFVKHD